jgi:hypothetical protein
MTDKEKARARYARYNNSAKGMARRRRYEEKHPERAVAWSKLMELKARRS